MRRLDRSTSRPRDTLQERQTRRARSWRGRRRGRRRPVARVAESRALRFPRDCSGLFPRRRTADALSVGAGGCFFIFGMTRPSVRQAPTPRARWTGHARPAIAWNTVRTSRNEKTGGRPASMPSEVGDGRSTRPCLPPARTWKLEGAGICGVPSRGKVSRSWSGVSVSVSDPRRRSCQCPMIGCRPWRDILSEPGVP